MVKVSFFSSTFLLLLFCTNFILIRTVSSTLPCPVNFTYLENYRTQLLPCQQDPYSVRCCSYLMPVLVIGLSQYLRESSMFLLPNASYTPSCVSTLKQKLNASSADAVSLCFKEMSVFVANNNSGCHGIVSLQDWNKKVGPTPSLDTSCKGDLSYPACRKCLDDVTRVADPLMSGSSKVGEINSCSILTVMYAAGIVNQYGPMDNRTNFCLMLTLGDDEQGQQSSKGLSKGRVLKLVFGIVGGLIFLAIGVFVLLYRKRYRREKGVDREPTSSSNQSDVRFAKMGLQWFRLQELERATDGFSSKNMVGKGTFGVVYRGTLEVEGGSSLVAVKELLEVESFGNEKEFANEVEIVSKIKHKNLLPLRGCCVDMKGKRRFLIYDFMANGSVADHLSNMSLRVRFSWEQRKNVILDVAKGLVYLHCGVKPAIYHRDIKASNILLDMDLRAKVADFGLARQGKDDGVSHITTRVAGTHGFLAPEYAMYGHLTHKSDVYSFGVLILEIVTAKAVIDTSSSCSSAVLITDWAWNLVKSGKVEDIFDETMKDDEQHHGDTMRRFVMLGILCAHIVAARRPTITEALRMLEGDIEVPDIPDRPLAMSRESLALEVVHLLED
ncbi:Probable receptor-like protein kinase At1g11050 [Linum perenne]